MKTFEAGNFSIIIMKYYNGILVDKFLDCCECWRRRGKVEENIFEIIIDSRLCIDSFIGNVFEPTT